MAYFIRRLLTVMTKAFLKLDHHVSVLRIWVTQGIKRSSNHKNKLFKKWICSHSADDQQKYKDYEEIFKKVTLAAQTAYYKEQEAQLSQTGRAMPRVVEYFG